MSGWLVSNNVIEAKVIISVFEKDVHLRKFHPKNYNSILPKLAKNVVNEMFLLFIHGYHTYAKSKILGFCLREGGQKKYIFCPN